LSFWWKLFVEVRDLPGLDFQTWETSEAGIEENKNPLVEVHRFPGP